MPLIECGPLSPHCLPFCPPLNCGPPAPPLGPGPGLGRLSLVLRPSAQLLLAAGCNLEFTNASGDDVLHLAARFGNTKLVLLLAEGDKAPPARVRPAHLNANGDTGLMLAVAQVTQGGGRRGAKGWPRYPVAPLALSLYLIVHSTIAGLRARYRR